MQRRRRQKNDFLCSCWFGGRHLCRIVFPVYIPPEYGKMLSVALMAALDTAFGGIRSSMEGSYDNTVFITGFFTNAVLAAFLCYVGMILGIDLYLVGILIFGMRIFQNLAAIRHLFLKK